MLPGAILFDLDDTLGDRKAAMRRYGERMIADFAPQLSDRSVDAAYRAIRAADSFGSIDQARTLRAAAIWRDAPDAETLYAHWQAHFGSYATPFPGEIDLLQRLRRAGIKLGIITNGVAKMQHAKIAALGVAPLMDTILISSEEGLEKPDPLIFARAAERLGCTMADCWFVGDNPMTDVHGAADAGMRAFWVKTGDFTADTVPGTILGALPELADYLELPA